MSELDEAEDAYDSNSSQNEELNQVLKDRMIQEEVKRDMNENFELPEDEEFKKMLITPFSAPFSQKVDGIPILNKDFGTSYLNKRTIRFVSLLIAGGKHTEMNPRLKLIRESYIQTAGTLLNLMPSLGGWGRTMPNTHISKKELFVENKEKKPEQNSGGIGGLLPWKSGR